MWCRFLLATVLLAPAFSATAQDPVEELRALQPPLLLYTQTTAGDPQTALYAAASTAKGWHSVRIDAATFLRVLPLSEGDVLIARGNTIEDAMVYTLDLFAPSALRPVTERQGLSPAWFQRRAENVQIDPNLGLAYVLFDASGAGDLEWIRYNYRENQVSERRYLSRDPLTASLSQKLALHISPNGRYIAFFTLGDTPTDALPGTRRYMLYIYEIFDLNRTLLVDSLVLARIRPDGGEAFAQPSLVWLDGENVLYPTLAANMGEDIVVSFRVANAVRVETTEAMQAQFPLPPLSPVLFREPATRQIHYSISGSRDLALDVAGRVVMPYDRPYRPQLEVEGDTVRVRIDDRVVFNDNHFARRLSTDVHTLDGSRIAFTLATPAEIGDANQQFVLHVVEGEKKAQLVAGPAQQITPLVWLPL